MLLCGHLVFLSFTYVCRSVLHYKCSVAILVGNRWKRWKTRTCGGKGGQGETIPTFLQSLFKFKCLTFVQCWWLKTLIHTTHQLWLWLLDVGSFCFSKSQRWFHSLLSSLWGDPEVRWSRDAWAWTCTCCCRLFNTCLCWVSAVANGILIYFICLSTGRSWCERETRTKGTMCLLDNGPSLAALTIIIMEVFYKSLVLVRHLHGTYNYIWENIIFMYRHVHRWSPGGAEAPPPWQTLIDKCPFSSEPLSSYFTIKSRILN